MVRNRQTYYAFDAAAAAAAAATTTTAFLSKRK